MADWSDALGDYLGVHGVGGALSQLRDRVLQKYRDTFAANTPQGEGGTDQLSRMATSAVASTLGAPGDMEHLLGVEVPAIAFTYAKLSSDTPGRAHLALEAGRTAQEPNILPTTQAFREWLGVGSGVPEQIGSMLGATRPAAQLTADALHAAAPALVRGARNAGVRFARPVNNYPDHIDLDQFGLEAGTPPAE